MVAEHNAQSPSGPRWVWAALLALVALVAAIYGRSVGFPFLDWDDLRFIVANPLVNGGDVTLADRVLTPSTGYLAPVTLNLQALFWTVSGGAPWLFHAFNLVVHAVNIALVVALARKLGAGPVASLVAAALFGFHPLVVEPVCWATGLKDLLALFGALSATFLFVSGRLRVAVGLLLVAVLAKPTGATVGAAWLAASAWFLWSSRRSGSAPSASTGIPWASTSGVGSAVLASLVGILVLGLGAFQHNVGLIEEPVDTTGWLFQPAMALGYYAHHLVWPSGLHPMYLVDRAAGLGDVHTWLGLLVMAAAVTAVVRLRRRPRVLLPLLIAAAMYAPVSNLAPFPRFLADSYAYAPLAFVAVAGAVGAGKLGRQRWAAAMAVPCLVAMVILSAAQVGRWQANATLWAPVAGSDDRWAQPWLLLAQGFALDGALESSARAYAQFHARTDSTRYVASHAQLLERAGDLIGAECVMAHEVAQSHANVRARHNLALFLVRNPTLKVRYVVQARDALTWAQSARSGDLLRWPQALQASIDSRLDTVSGSDAGGTHGRAEPVCQALTAAPRPLAEVFPELAP